MRIVQQRDPDIDIKQRAWRRPWPRGRCLAGLWDRQAREFAELLYQWEGPLLLDDSRVRRALPGWVPTPPDEALARTVAWYRERP